MLDISLPPDIASRAAGRFASFEDVFRGGVESAEDDDAAAEDKLAYLRREAADAFAELDRGEYVRGTAKEIMTTIRAEVDAALQTEGIGA